MKSKKKIIVLNIILSQILVTNNPIVDDNVKYLKKENFKHTCIKTYEANILYEYQRWTLQLWNCTREM